MATQRWYQNYRVYSTTITPIMSQSSLARKLYSPSSKLIRNTLMSPGSILPVDQSPSSS